MTLKMSEKKLHYIKRFGAIAVERDYISVEQLIEALIVQVRDEMMHGTHRLLGSILFERDAITAEQLQDVLEGALSHDPIAA